jgi:hypothetical protein
MEEPQGVLQSILPVGVRREESGENFDVPEDDSVIDEDFDNRFNYLNNESFDLKGIN